MLKHFGRKSFGRNNSRNNGRKSFRSHINPTQVCNQMPCLVRNTIWIRQGPIDVNTGWPIWSRSTVCWHLIISYVTVYKLLILKRNSYLNVNKKLSSTRWPTLYISSYPTGEVFLLMSAALVGTVFYVLLVSWVICITCGKSGSAPQRLKHFGVQWISDSEVA